MILHTSADAKAHVTAFALQPEAKFVFHQGEWTVLESTLPQVPVDSPDEPAPIPHPATLRKRTKTLMEELWNRPVGEDALPETTPTGQTGP